MIMREMIMINYNMNETNLKITLDDPVLVCQSPYRSDADWENIPVPADDPYGKNIVPFAKAWGKYRAPKLFRLPDGSVCYSVTMSFDHYYDQGRPSMLFVAKSPVNSAPLGDIVCRIICSPLL